MSEQEKQTEALILAAAKKVFVNKGLDGARTQEIADEAGINKALVHYYFRTKEKLFDAVFQEAFNQFLPRISFMMVSDFPILKKIEIFIDTYMDLLIENPHLPAFIIHEVNRNPDFSLIEILRTKGGIQPEIFFAQVQKEVDAGNIMPINPPHLMINILGLCIFPFAGKPIIKGFIFHGDNEKYEKFIMERKQEVTQFVINALKVK
jgi:TetR/AcrR family transcriptional regulator